MCSLSRQFPVRASVFERKGMYTSSDETVEKNKPKREKPASACGATEAAQNLHLANAPTSVEQKCIKVLKKGRTEMGKAYSKESENRSKLHLVHEMEQVSIRQHWPLIHKMKADNSAYLGNLSLFNRVWVGLLNCH
jgi:hypothetical protein